MKRIPIVCQVVALLCAAMLSGCGEKQISWKEEVKLQSGEVIVVKRTAKSKDFGEVGGGGGWENEGMTVQVVQPAVADNPPVWDARYVPLIFDRDPVTKEWLMVATFYSCTSWYELDRPKLPYAEYRVKNGKWLQRALSPELIGRPGNMLTHIRSSGEPDHTVASKEAINARPNAAPEFRRVVDSWNTGC